MMAKIDRHEYPTGKAFLADAELICNNALEYNPDETTEDRGIRHRACTLKDVAHAIMSAGETLSDSLRSHTIGFVFVIMLMHLS